MNLDKKDLLLYAVTDRAWVGDTTLAQQVKAALSGGTTMLQLREKDMDAESFLAEALEIGALCKSFNVPFIINDEVEIAIKCGAQGVHVGQSDMAAGEARKRVGPDMILGVSAQTVQQALLAEENGADYLGVGAVFSTSTKPDADDVSKETLREICAAVSIPVVAIGGITAENISELSGTGIAGAAVVSALFAQKNIEKAARNLRAKLEKVVSE